ncbi:MAG TPA: hypothetical protein PLP50_01890 [Thermoanaerobaculia bacterium]|nr:hypothetical protein [Thermoanaerobaculia bacterium]HQN06494.1 hypothetical protein [Thermoanaerobaculia bacterium]HQP84856.1 hypothetical protein [Thermoanaerobaculia bacterium]
MNGPSKDEGFEEPGALVDAEKKAALAAFDGEAFARRVRRAVAAEPARTERVWLRPVLAGALATLLLAASLAAWRHVRNAPEPDPAIVAAALRGCTFFAASEEASPSRPRIPEADGARAADLVWVVQAVVHGARRSGASGRGGPDDLAGTVLAAFAGGRPGGPVEWKAVPSEDLARRLGELSRGGGLARAIAGAS